MTLPSNWVDQLRAAHRAHDFNTRNQLIVAAVNHGHSRPEVGAPIGLSRERIRQIAKRPAPKPDPPLKLLAQLHDAVADGDVARRNHLIVAAVNAGWSQAKVAAASRVSRRRIRQLLDEANAPAGPPDPLATLPTEVARRLGCLREKAQGVTGAVSLEDPRRKASEEFTALVADLVDRNYRKQVIAEAAQMPWPSLRARLARHGYIPAPPSMRVYARAPIGDRDICRQNHPRTERNTSQRSGPNGTVTLVCLVCHAAAQRRYVDGQNLSKEPAFSAN